MIDRPNIWTPELVGVRLIQAFKTLKRTPVQMYPRGFFGEGYWPEYIHSFGEISEWGEEGQEELVKSRVRLRHRPSPVEITEMEEAIGWPAQYLKDTPNDCRIVLIWATAKADRRKIKPIIDRKNWAKSSFHKALKRGLNKIALGLTDE